MDGIDWEDTYRFRKQIFLRHTARSRSVQYYRDLLLSFPKSAEEKFPSIGGVPEGRGGTKSPSRFLDKLLDGVEVEWVALGEVAAVTIGEFVHKDKQDVFAEYPVYNGGTSNTGFYDKFNNKGKKIIVSARGANAGFVNRITSPYWAGNSCYSIGIKNTNEIDWSYIYYYLKNSENKLISGQQKGSIPAVSKKQMETFQIPIPSPNNPKKSLEIQGEIVRILDTFSTLTAELTAELTARKKQYQYYRDLLLSFPKSAEEKFPSIGGVPEGRGGTKSPSRFLDKLLDGVEVAWVALGEVANIKHGKDWKGLEKGSVPVYGSGGIMAYVDTFSYNKPTVLIPRKGTITNIFYLETSFWNVDTIFYTEIDTSKLLPKYLYHFIKTIDLMALDTGSGRPSLTQAILNKVQIPIPSPNNPKKSLEIQGEIVRILDKFDTLTNSISDGLPREIELRQKQYEYYRDLLLSFPKSAEEKYPSVGGNNKWGGS